MQISELPSRYLTHPPAVALCDFGVLLGSSRSTP
jgi:hypothetical protein